MADDGNPSLVKRRRLGNSFPDSLNEIHFLEEQKPIGTWMTVQERNKQWQRVEEAVQGINGVSADDAFSIGVPAADRVLKVTDSKYRAGHQGQNVIVNCDAQADVCAQLAWELRRDAGSKLYDTPADLFPDVDRAMRPSKQLIEEWLGPHEPTDSDREDDDDPIDGDGDRNSDDEYEPTPNRKAFYDLGKIGWGSPAEIKAFLVSRNKNRWVEPFYASPYWNEEEDAGHFEWNV